MQVLLHYSNTALKSFSKYPDHRIAYLVESDTRRGVHRRVQLDIALAPVLDHRDYK